MNIGSLSSLLRRFAGNIGDSKNIDDYMEGVRDIFVDIMKRDPSLKKSDPERVWHAIEPNIRRDVEKHFKILLR